MAAIATESYVEAVTTMEKPLLAKLPAPLRAAACVDPKRLAALKVAERADFFASTEAEQRHEELQLLAAVARERVRLGQRGPGRPPKPPEQAELEEHEREAKDIGFDAGRSADSWLKRLDEFRQAAPHIEGVDETAAAQHAAVAKGLEHLAQAATAFDDAAALAEKGRAMMARYSNLVTWSGSPFVVLGLSRNDLTERLRRLRFIHEAELARVGADPAEELEKQREAARLSVVRQDMNDAANKFRRTPDGAQSWKVYRASVGAYEEQRRTEPLADHEDHRVRVQNVLVDYYKAASVFAGCDFDVESVPTLG